MAIDDYDGDVSRYQSIYHLVDYIKVDIQAVDMFTITNSLKLLKTNYKVELIAERVETHADFEFCKEIGFDLFQGYYFCRPIMVSRPVDPIDINVDCCSSALVNSLATADVTRPTPILDHGI